jgi:hypothetical protein
MKLRVDTPADPLLNSVHICISLYLYVLWFKRNKESNLIYGQINKKSSTCVTSALTSKYDFILIYNIII